MNEKIKNSGAAPTLLKNFLNLNIEFHYPIIDCSNFNYNRSSVNWFKLSLFKRPSIGEEQSC